VGRAQEKQTTEDTEKANHGGHGGHAKKQTTENTENTEMEKRGRVEVECGGVRAGSRGNSRSVRDCAALPA